MNYADIKTIDIQDGDGVRVSLYVSGCHFHCKGCHNKEAWDFNYGKKFEDSTIDYIIDLMNHDYIAGLSILGGEPLEPINQKELVKLVERVKEVYPNKTIWCYTGYNFDKDVFGKMYNELDETKKILPNIDIIVDGEFIEENKLIDLKFRGSTNQRKIDVKESLKAGKMIQLKFGDEVRYEKNDNPKIIWIKKYDNNNDNEVVAETEEKVYSAEKTMSDDNEVEVIPAIHIEPVKVKVAADTINKKVIGNL